MLHRILKVLSLLILFSSVFNASDKKVLVEILTNSHCPLCPPTHSIMDNYLQSDNGDNIEYIYYHMAFPYSNDQLYQYNMSDAVAKNNFYGPHSSTPKAYFDGNLVPNSYSNWSSNLDNLVTQESPFEIDLSGIYTDSDITISANMTRTGDVEVSDLTINYVVVEDLTYAGNNGITDHKNVMRKIVEPAGESFSINPNETITLSAKINKDTEWDNSNISVVVFIQSRANKTVFQSASIDYKDLMLTDIEDEEILPQTFILKQNYPNPFNPSTLISYSIPNDGYVTLVIYDILGNEVSKLEDGYKTAGNYNYNFDASKISNGVYFYKLQAGEFTETKKMLLLK